MSERKKLYRAGLIPFVVEDSTIKMMFIVPDDPSGKYGGETPQIAKGKIENGETILSAALREAKEELGLFEGNVEYTEEVGVFMGRTTVFVGKIIDTNLFGDPTTPHEVKDRLWLTLEQFMEQGRDLHKPVVKAAHRKICKMEQLVCE